MPHTLSDDTYYFAYGSNLNTSDWEAFCSRIGTRPEVIEPVGTAVLPDMQLCFDYFSGSRGGGALNVRPALGQVVHGVLYRAGPQGWAALDRKEGAPHCYERTGRVAIRPDGAQVKVITYEVTDDMRTAFCPPTEAYRQIVADGLSAWELPVSGLEDAAQNKLPRFEIDKVFVYGTLMQGQRNAQVIPSGAIRELRLATTIGTLYDTGCGFPAVVLGGQERSLVFGECVHLSTLPKVLRAMDALEGFGGFDDPEPLFRRTIVPVQLGQGEKVRAWCYVSPHQGLRAQKIAGGCWRSRTDQDI